MTGFPGGPSGEELPGNARDIGDEGLIPSLGRSPGGGNGNPLQYSCPENPMDRGAWQAAVHGVAKSQTRLSDEHSHIPGKALEEADMENLVPSSIMGPPAQSSRELGRRL